MQLVELGDDLAPDARFFRRVVDDRGTEPLPPVFAAQGEQLAATLNIGLVAEAGMTGLEFERGRFGRRDHRLGVDGRSVLDQGVGIIHGDHLEWTAHACTPHSPPSSLDMIEEARPALGCLLSLYWNYIAPFSCAACVC